MNRSPSSPLEPWRAHLATLPEVDPPEHLWRRLEAAHQSAQRPPRARWPWLAAAAALAVAVLSWPRPDAVSPVEPLLAATPVVDQNLRLLDQELTSAYARQANDAEIAALWQTRERVLTGDAQSDPPLLARL
jgi:hypothetical protein